MSITMKQARVGAGLTMEEVARQMHIHPQTYASWEKNPENVKIKYAKQFALIVNESIDDIIFMPSGSN